jgi:large subunit ribosomal protein L31
LKKQAYNKILANIDMKKDIHPATYRTVVFKDISTDETFLGKTCANAKDTITWEDGNEYPLIKMEISAFSHPFFTGKMKFVDTAGRIDKFNKKFAGFTKTAPASEEAPVSE